MKNILFKLLLAFNALIWIVLSIVNYVGIMLQLNENLMKIFLWSIITVTMYGVVIYSMSLVLTRIFQMYQYKDIKTKYISMRSFMRQIILLTSVILYLYGACYYNSIFIGLLPMLLFFSKMLTSIGKFYIYDNGRLLVIEDFSNEYMVKDIILRDKKLVFEEIHTRNLDVKEASCNLDSDESKFLSGFFLKETNEMEVA